MKTTESRSRNAIPAGSKADEHDRACVHLHFLIQLTIVNIAVLPRSAAWAQKTTTSQSNTTISHHGSSSSVPRQAPRRGTVPRQPRGIVSHPHPTASETRPANARVLPERKPAKPSSQASSSRPTTPAGGAPSPRTPAAVEVKPSSRKEDVTSPPPRASSPPRPVAGLSESNTPEDISPIASITQPPAPESAPPSILSTPIVPPGLPAVPPGLAAPSGVPPSSRPARVSTASPQTPLLASQSSYQMSSAARALLDDVKARRESVLTMNMGLSPFPDFDRTLQTLSGGDSGGFSFNLDPNLAASGEGEVDPSLTNFEGDANVPFHGTFVDAFPALRTTGSTGHPPFSHPPGLPYPHNPTRSIYDPFSVRSGTGSLERQQASYAGSFNPFADTADESAAQHTRTHPASMDDDPSRKMSRFVFARGRQGSMATPSPSHVASPLSSVSNDGHSFHGSSDGPTTITGQPQWVNQEYINSQSASTTGSPLLQQALVNSPQQSAIFHPFDSGVSEAQLRDLIQSSRVRERPPIIPLITRKPRALY